MQATTTDPTGRHGDVSPVQPDERRAPARAGSTGTAARRPRIAFFDYPDVFEDFYPHLGVDQRGFATTWARTGNHAFLTLLQREVGDVTWYAFSLRPEL